MPALLTRPGQRPRRRPRRGAAAIDAASVTSSFSGRDARAPRRRSASSSLRTPAKHLEARARADASRRRLADAGRGAGDHHRSTAMPASWPATYPVASRRGGARRGDPRAAHPQGLRRRARRPGDARRAVRARALGAQPPPHQPVALPRRSARSARAPEGGGRPGGGGQARPRADAGGRASVKQPATRSRTRRTSAPAAWPSTSCCSARTRAGWPATGARPACCARRRAAPRSAWSDGRARARADPPRPAAPGEGAARAPAARRLRNVPAVIARADALAALERDEFDVVVIGGGITGAGRRARRRLARVQRRAGRARRLRVGHLEPLLEAGPRRPALPPELRPRAGARGAARALADGQPGAAPGQAAAAAGPGVRGQAPGPPASAWG